MDELEPVDPLSRLFPESLCIGGWGHIFGGVMKRAVLYLATRVVYSFVCVFVFVFIVIEGNFEVKYTHTKLYTR